MDETMSRKYIGTYNDVNINGYARTYVAQKQNQYNALAKKQIETNKKKYRDTYKDNYDRAFGGNAPLIMKREQYINSIDEQWQEQSSVFEPVDMTRMMGRKVLSEGELRANEVQFELMMKNILDCLISASKFSLFSDYEKVMEGQIPLDKVLEGSSIKKIVVNDANKTTIDIITIASKLESTLKNINRSVQIDLVENEMAQSLSFADHNIDAIIRNTFEGKSIALQQADKNIKIQAGDRATTSTQKTKQSPLNLNVKVDIKEISAGMKNMLFLLNHLKQISGTAGNSQWIETLDKLNNAIAEGIFSKAVNNTLKNEAYFIAEGDTLYPAYTLFDSSDDLNLNGLGYDWNQKKDYELLIDDGYFNRNFDYSKYKYNPYVEYVNQKVMSKVSIQLHIQAGKGV
jgi:hypothetical protein